MTTPGSGGDRGDRRGGPRQPTPAGTVVRVKFKNKKQFRSCWVKDISRNGIFLRTATPLPVFERITVVLELPDGQEMELHGDVVHAIPPSQAGPGAAAGMGVQFGDLTADKRAILELYLERMRTLPPRGALDRNTLRPGELDRNTLRPSELDQNTVRPSELNRNTVRPGELVAAASMEDMLQALRRLLWLCADAAELSAADYYQLLGVPPDATRARISAACQVMRILLDPQSAPEGVDAAQTVRFSSVLMVLAEIEDCLTDPKRRAAYDEARAGILR